MKYTYWVIAVAISFLFVSCKQDDTNHFTEVNFPEIEILSQDFKTKAKFLETEPIELPANLFAARGCYVYYDSILVVCNRAYENHPFIEVYNLYSKALITKKVYRGNGPGEMTNGYVNRSEDCLNVRDIMKSRIASIKIDELIKGDSSLVIFHPYKYFTQYVTFYKDSSQFVFINSNRFVDKKQGIYQGGPSLIIGDDNYIDKTRYKYNTFNITGNEIVTSYDNNRIVRITESDRIEFFDNNLNPLKLIQGPDDFDSKIKYFIGKEYSAVYHTSPYIFTGSHYTKKHLYCGYYGQLIKRGNMSDKYNYPYYILKFDWNGNLVDSYWYHNQQGGLIFPFSISENEDIIYLSTTDEAGNVLLLKALL
jgi:hypothetical protein